MADVSLSLKDARALLKRGAGANNDAPWHRLAAAIRRTERALTPSPRWHRDSTDGRWSYRLWPLRRGGTIHGCAAIVSPFRWSILDSDGTEITDGPETGAEGRRLADRALSRWLKRQGVDWTGEARRG